MAISPDEVRNKTFAIVRKGYEQGDVNRYLYAIAAELEAFNSSAAAQDEIVLAEVVDVEPSPPDPSEIIAMEIPSESDPVADLSDTTDEPERKEPARQEPARKESVRSPSGDDFDRVGNEISLMLRQAQESSIKIRQDAEVEARTLVDQIRLDIESDRLAHEQAAGELITRTEERAAAVRAEAEDYAQRTRSGADEYAIEHRESVENELSEAIKAAEADRNLAAEKLAAVTGEADAAIAEATKRADEIIANAESDAQARSDQLLGEARSTLKTLIEAEKSSRDNLDTARANIQTALDQLRLTDIDASAIASS